MLQNSIWVGWVSNLAMILQLHSLKRCPVKIYFILSSYDRYMCLVSFKSSQSLLHFWRICVLQVATDHLGQECKSQVLCSLQYWSDCHARYMPYTQFQLSESEMCRLELPAGPHQVCLQRMITHTSSSSLIIQSDPHDLDKMTRWRN
jgi:hypothetical protein